MAQQIENSVLEMALIGYEVERLKIESAMAAIRIQLADGSSRALVSAKVDSATDAKPKRNMSAAGRKAISDATKKRWAAFHAAEKVEKPATKAAMPKRKMSRATKAKLTANLAKARAAKAAKKAQEPAPF